MQTVRRFMKKRIIICVVLLLGIVVGIIAPGHSAGPRGPIYKGKPVSEWITICVRRPGNSFAGTNEIEFLPVFEIGADAVPYLISAIEHEPGFTGSKFYAALRGRLPAGIANKLPVPVDRAIV